MPEVSFPIAVVGGVPVVTAPEEIDVTNVPGLRAALADAAGDGNVTLVVDMSRTQFCDSSGLNVLVRAHQEARAQGGEVLLVISASAVLRILALTGADRVIPNFPSLDEALGQGPPLRSTRQCRPAGQDLAHTPGDKILTSDHGGTLVAPGNACCRLRPLRG